MAKKNRYIITSFNAWHKDYFDEPEDYKLPIKRTELTVPIEERWSKQTNLCLNEVLGLKK